jgi:hypothetical protein
VLVDIRVSWFKSILVPILRDIVRRSSSVGLRPSKGDSGTSTYTILTSKVCPGRSTLRTVAP